MYSQSQVQVGYTVLTADPGARAPVGSVLLSYTNTAGVLVSQAGVSAVEPISSGRIFVEEVGTHTGIALDNPSTQDASVTWVLRDPAGRELNRKSQSLAARGHLASYVSQLFTNLTANFTGSLTFEGDRKLAAITLRESHNSRGEPLYTTLPVAELGLATRTQALVFPQIAAGEGYTTQVVLINTTSQQLRGTISLTGSDGLPLFLRSREVTASQFSYSIDPDGTYRAEFDRPSGLGVGYAVVTPDSGNSAPSGTAIFQFRKDGALVTEAGVGATRSTSLARIYVDNVGSLTGIALSNPENQSAVVTFSLLDRYGELIRTSAKTLDGKHHLAIFAHELFSGLSSSFTGLMEISSTSPIYAVTLKQTENARGDQVLTTLPVADLNNLPTASSLIFPHIAIDEGFSTRLILINGEKTKPATGNMSFYRSDGSSMTITLGSKKDSQFNYEISAGGGRQMFPGETASVASLSLLDPSSYQPTKEVVVNEGKTVRLNLLVLDTAGQAREDFEPTYTSISPETASIDASGNIEGKKAGFSTLTVASGGVVATGTITVVKIESGVTGFEVTGIVQDLARRLYLANTGDHTVLLVEDLKKTAAVYAGVSKTSGLKNDLRIQSWFKNPAFLAYNQVEGSLYLSDSANHIIRRIQPGLAGKVETFAGTGAVGDKNGPAAAATFNNPQGVALDNRGNLWVADSDNHTIRRISLAKGTVELIAGRTGVAGWVDGTGDGARFSSPKGIAFETESLAQQLEREKKGDPPPPPSVIVADTGNGVLRRVKENGEVQTIRSGGASSTNALSHAAASAAPVLFDSPAGVAIDYLGNIYVTEPNSGHMRTVLKSGDVVTAAQANTFLEPRGVAIAESGKIVVAERNRAAREIIYGTPQITAITPDRISNQGGTKITIRGSNFAPDALVLVVGTIIADRTIRDTQTISFTAPILPSGRGTVTVHTRGGLAQTSLQVDAVELSKLAAGYTTTVAGGTTFFGDGGPATSGVVSDPYWTALDPSGHIYIADTANHRVRRVEATTGIITTIVGTGAEGFSGDNGPAIAAQLSFPGAIAIDSSGNLLIADTSNHRIRKVDSAKGTITTIAGTGQAGFRGDKGPSASADLYSPHGMAIDAEGNLFIADEGNNRIRRIDASTGTITTVAGTGQSGFGGDDGQATSAQIWAPRGIALDQKGNLFISDRYNHRIRKVDVTSGLITTVAGTGQLGFSGDNGLATAARFDSPEGVVVDAEGNLLIADSYNQRIRKMDSVTRIITTIAGKGLGVFSGDNGLATEARLSYPGGVAIDGSGNVLIADTLNDRIRKVAAATNIITTIVGIGQNVFSGDDGAATAALLNYPEGMAIDSKGNLYVADTWSNRIRKVNAATGIITTVAGNGTKGSSGDNGLATSAQFRLPSGVALDSSNNIFISDSYNRVRKVNSATGIITTVAGTGASGFSGDDGPATTASLKGPRGIHVDAAGNLFIVDTYNHRIRKVDAVTRVITTVAGSGTAGFSGDNGVATFAQLSYPEAITTDTAGNLWIADTFNHRIRKVDRVTRIITTVAGTGGFGFSGDAGAATAAKMRAPRGIYVDAAGNLFIADTWNNRVRKVDGKTGIITTVAGIGETGFAGDNGPATSARMHYPFGSFLDAAGNLFVVDTNNLRIRAIRGPM